MANRLKEIFSKELPELKLNINYQDSELSERFLDELPEFSEREKVEVSKYSIVKTEYIDKNIQYPMDDDCMKEYYDNEPLINKYYNNKPSMLNNATINESFPIKVETTHFGERIIYFYYYKEKNKTILETDKNQVIYLKLILNDNMIINEIIYIVDYTLASTIKELYQIYNTVIAFFDVFFTNKEKKKLLNNQLEYFFKTEKLFSYLYYLEQSLNISFQPKDLNNDINSEVVAIELYMLLIKKKAICRNTKPSTNELSEMIIQPFNKEIKIGNKLETTFIKNLEYELYGQKIQIYTVNLLSNAIIKGVNDREDGTIQILYGDTDLNPMYISYMGFKTIEQAQKELKLIMKHKRKYSKALTLDKYIEKEVYKMA